MKSFLMLLKGDFMSRSEPELLQSYQFNVFADYFQIYLQDEQAAEEWNLPNDWGNQFVSQMIGVAPGTVAIGTVRNVDVPVEIQLLNSRPSDDLTVGDHITEASLDIPSGKLVVVGCSDYLPDATRIPVQSGNYRVRIYYSELESMSEDGFEGNDHYKVLLWPEESSDLKIIKKWPRIS
jgi:hypothetical protein